MKKYLTKKGFSLVTIIIILATLIVVAGIMVSLNSSFTKDFFSAWFG